MADFIDKVTSKELFNLTIKRITCVTLFGMVSGFPFVSGLKVDCLLLAKSQKVLDAKSKKSAKIKMYCMRLSDTFLQLPYEPLQKVICYPLDPFACGIRELYATQIIFCNIPQREIKSKYKNGDI